MVKVQVEERDDPGFATIILGAATQHNELPPWMQFSDDGLDEAHILYGGKWGCDNESLVTIIGPSSRTIEFLKSATGKGANDETERAAQVRVMTECLFSLPSTFVARRPFVVDETVILDNGVKLPPPADLEIPEELNGKKVKVLDAYIREVLPNRLWGMVLTATWIMSTPDLSRFMKELEKKTEEAAKEAETDVGEEDLTDPNSPKDSSGSSEEK